MESMCKQAERSGGEFVTDDADALDLTGELRTLHLPSDDAPHGPPGEGRDDRAAFQARPIRGCRDDRGSWRVLARPFDQSWT